MGFLGVVHFFVLAARALLKGFAFGRVTFLTDIDDFC